MPLCDDVTHSTYQGVPKIFAFDPKWYSYDVHGVVHVYSSLHHKKACWGRIKQRKGGGCRKRAGHQLGKPKGRPEQMQKRPQRGDKIEGNQQKRNPFRRKIPSLQRSSTWQIPQTILGGILIIQIRLFIPYKPIPQTLSHNSLCPRLSYYYTLPVENARLLKDSRSM